MSTDNLNDLFRVDKQAEVALVARRTDHPDAAAMLDAFYREQVGRYGFAESVDLDPDVYNEPNGIFIVVYRGGEPTGCGGCRRFEPSGNTFEIKKTYLAPEARGHGLGRRLLEELERTAVAHEARRIILETGVRNSAAQRLFTRNGYTPTARYVAGRDPAINRAYEKLLRRSSPDFTAQDVQPANA